jgi:RHS repeat-associated protein
MMKKKIFSFILILFVYVGHAQVKNKDQMVPMDAPSEEGGCTGGCYRWNRDWDRDTFGDPNVSMDADEKPDGYVANQSDCNDSEPSLNPYTVWYLDGDKDGFGTPSSTVVQCTDPSVVNGVKYVRNDSDCDDILPSINPNTVWYLDGDKDGFGTASSTKIQCTDPSVVNGVKYVLNASDCDDILPSINPNTVWYLDGDKDGFGTASNTKVQCTDPSANGIKYVLNASDCNDILFIVNPNIVWYLDGDKDGFGTASSTKTQCTDPSANGVKYVLNASDCDDVLPSINPNTKWYPDIDEDGLGDPSSFLQQCDKPNGNYVLDNTDNCPLIKGTSPSCASLNLTPLDQNYIITTTYKQPTGTVIAKPEPNKAQVNITYFDGLGRPIQQIANQQSAMGKDIITHIEYDGFGRQTKEYLPFESTTTDMVFDPLALNNTLRFYNTVTYEKTNNPFSDKKLEPSPLNRVLKQAAPGTVWGLENGNGHEIKTDYQTNTATEVKLYNANTTWNAGSGLYDIAFADNGNYTINELHKTITYDENSVANPTDEKSGSTVEFKNKNGQVVLKRTYSNYTDTQGNITATEVKHDTYYVYDDYGNLTYVMPPKATDNINFINVQNDITSTAVVNSGSTLQLMAKNSIVLLPGFNAQSGSVFTASIVSATANNGQSTLDNLCYQYKYDNRNRLVEKKLPGKQWEFIVYDKLDRPILTQDAELRKSNKWLFTKYDAFSRPVYTGEYVNATNTTRAAVQTLANAGITQFETKQGSNTINGSTVYYSNNAFPNAGIDLFTINYYDDYNFDLNGGVAETAYNIPPIINAKGLATGSKIRILGQTTWITNVIYYNTKGRPIYNYSKNDFLATTAKVKSQLDFVGKVLETTSTHTRAAVTTSIIDTYGYDHAGRLLSQKQKVNAQPEEIIVANTYDSLGQLTSKGIGGKTTQNRLQTVDYAYNIRGWLKAINNVAAIGSDLFAFKINYNGIAAGVTPLYNGNISQTQWKTASLNTTGNPVSNSYAYSYDALNRLTMATDNSDLTANRYNESLSYDKNGNILGLLRKGNTDANATIFGTMDNLAYTYDTGNKLVKVEDISGSTEGFKNGSTATTEYTYDDNGNMISDLNKNISTVTYNYLNLPTQVTIGGANVNYIYDATGAKQRKTVNGITTDYAGGFIYENNVMKFFSQPEGYVANTTGIFSYIYQYKDHLGNVRLSYKDVSLTNTPSLQIEEENNYYPFGLKQKGYNSVATSTNPGLKYKYNGKELQDENIGGQQLNWYDYSARNYDPALGRWMNIDPLAETSRRFSPYTYALNNPVFFIDPDGMQAVGGLFGQDEGGLDMTQKDNRTAQERYYDSKSDDSSFGIAGQADAGSESGGPGDPPKPGTGTSTGNMQGHLPNGAPNGVDITIGLDPVVIKGYKAPAYSSGAYGPYNPRFMNPDGIGLTLNFHLNTSLFGELSLVGGFALSNDKRLALFGGRAGNFGYTGKLGELGFDWGLTFDSHYKYGEEKDVLNGIDGSSKGYFMGYGASGSYSTSAIQTANGGFVPSPQGVKTVSFGLGAGAGTTISKVSTWEPFK